MLMHVIANLVNILVQFMLVKKFFRIYVNEIYFCLFRHVEHDGKIELKTYIV
jgi:hypothetical protein